MAGLFKALFHTAKRTPEEVVVQLEKDLVLLGSRAAAGVSDGDDEINKDIQKRVEEIKAIIYGDTSDDHGKGAAGGSGDHHPDAAAIEALAKAIMDHEIMFLALAHLKSVNFEVRKSFVTLFVHLLRKDIAGFATVYMPKHTDLLHHMVFGYASTEIALNCGTMLRECIAQPALHAALLYGPDGGLSKPLCDLFDNHVHNPNFEVATDAFETLTAILTSNKELVFACFNPNGDAASLARYNELFSMYNKMLQSDNYVLKRQSLKLLSEFLLDRDNFNLMMKYIQDRSNLRVIMTLLRHNQPNIQFEAFHVFKVFVANPEKPDDITLILSQNKVKIVDFLRKFQNEKDEAQFMEEKAMLIDTLQRLPDYAPPLSASSSGSVAGAAAGGAGGGGPLHSSISFPSSSPPGSVGVDASGGVAGHGHRASTFPLSESAASGTATGGDAGVAASGGYGVMGGAGVQVASASGVVPRGRAESGFGGGGGSVAAVEHGVATMGLGALAGREGGAGVGGAT